MHALNINNSMKVSSIECKLKHYISPMVICENYMLEFSVDMDMNKNGIRKEVAVWKVAAQFCLTLISKELKISVEHGRAVTTLDIIKH